VKSTQLEIFGIRKDSETCENPVWSIKTTPEIEIIPGVCSAEKPRKVRLPGGHIRMICYSCIAALKKEGVNLHVLGSLPNFNSHAAIRIFAIKRLSDGLFMTEIVERYTEDGHEKSRPIWGDFDHAKKYHAVTNLLGFDESKFMKVWENVEAEEVSENPNV